MSEPSSPFNDLSISPDLQQALTAAFGAEADDLGALSDVLGPGLSGEATPAKDGDAESRKNGSSSAEAADVSDSSFAALLDQVAKGIEDDLSVNLDGEDDTPVEPVVDNGVRHVVFQIGDRLFGIPLSGVMEIDRCSDVTPLPRTPNWLRGVTNLRGQILPVTDFRQLLNLSADRNTAEEKIIVVQSARHRLRTALIVDRVPGIRSLVGDSKPLSGMSSRVAEFAAGVSVKDQMTTILIDPDRLLGCDELQVFCRQ